VKGNLIVNKPLNIGNYKIEVIGDVIANSKIELNSGILNVEGDLIMQSSKATGGFATNFNQGTLTLKGNLLQLSAGDKDYFQEVCQMVSNW
jgi:hypothetical protein